MILRFRAFINIFFPLTKKFVAFLYGFNLIIFKVKNINFLDLKYSNWPPAKIYEILASVPLSKYTPNYPPNRPNLPLPKTRRLLLPLTHLST
jgi:hypothetical protein